MSASNMLYNFAFLFLGGLIVYALRPFLGSYSAKKGENLATKEDIAQITKVQEEIKAQISDQVWDRERQWELKRDAVLDAIRGLADLEDAVTNLDNVLTQPEGTPDEEASAALKSWRIDAFQQFKKCSSAFKRVQMIADLAVGGKVTTTLSVYFRFALGISGKSVQQKVPIPSDEMKELALRGNDVILSAREALGVTDAGDLPRFDESN